MNALAHLRAQLLNVRARQLVKSAKSLVFVAERCADTTAAAAYFACLDGDPTTAQVLLATMDEAQQRRAQEAAYNLANQVYANLGSG